MSKHLGKALFRSIVVVFFGLAAFQKAHSQEPAAPQQQKSMRELVISWGDGTSPVRIGLPDPGKHGMHVHPLNGVNESQYSAIRLIVTSSGNTVTVEAAAVIGKIEDHECKSLRAIPSDEIGTFTLGSDDAAPVQVSAFEDRGVKPFEMRVVTRIIQPVAAGGCPAQPPCCCAFSGGGHCVSCCPKAGACCTTSLGDCCCF